jgi:hypothetical protein
MVSDVWPRGKMFLPEVGAVTALPFAWLVRRHPAWVWWWHIPVVPALGSLRKENFEFKATLGNICCLFKIKRAFCLPPNLGSDFWTQNPLLDYRPVPPCLALIFLPLQGPFLSAWDVPDFFVSLRNAHSNC